MVGTDDAGNAIRTSIWLHPSISVQFIHEGEGRVELDGKQFEEMLEEAKGPGGLVIGDLERFPYSFLEANGVDASPGDRSS
ncbi:DUF7882 family protein [Prescottella equi]